MYGDDWEYAATRLHGTLVRLKDGSPVTVLDVEGCDEVVVRGITSRKNSTVRLDDLDCTPVPLGFVNNRNGATFLSRVPKRRDWRQGMRRENTSRIGYGETSSVGIKRTIEGKYPRLSAAIKRKSPLTAWHRHWAVSNTGQVFYKTRGVVGKVVDGAVQLDDKWFYLKEYLDESTKT